MFWRSVPIVSSRQDQQQMLGLHRPFGQNRFVLNQRCQSDGILNLLLH
jgi:hypothetical protein